MIRMISLEKIQNPDKSLVMNSLVLSFSNKTRPDLARHELV